ncbi:MAG TPA: RNA polymerase sigma factor [Spirochaetia bacterium]|nr:RNA polymerase sigma factor [Spirochaetia bacterium]
MDFDSGFIGRLKRRETAAFTALYTETETMLFNYLLCRTGGNRVWAEDLLQEVFSDALSHTGSLTPFHNVKAWLFRIARSKVADHFRRLERNGKWKSGVPVEELPGEKGGSRNPETKLLEEEHAAMVRAAFSRLSDAERELLEKKYVEDLSMREISALYGKSEKAIESLLYRARKELETILGSLEKERFYKGKREP